MAPYSNILSWVPFAVLTASFVGSAHCITMCGGLIVATTSTPRGLFFYHLGRLLGYLSLGALAGFFGAQLLSLSSHMKWISLVTSLIIGVGFLFAAIKVWRGQVPHFSILPKKILMKAYQKNQTNPFTTGLLTAFLPCGWLQVFVLGAVTTRGAFLGALFLFMFWLGTLPALTATPWLIKKIFQPVANRVPRLAACILIFAAIISVGVKIFPLFTTSEAQSQCIHQH